MSVVEEAQAALPERALLAQDKARVLREALPWITRWADRTVVVKVGGSVGQGETTSRMEAAFAADVALLRSVGLHVVVVHGGGPQISHLADRLGLRSEFVDGRRVTDHAMLEAVRYVLLGQVNPRLVGLISRAGAAAVGIAGTDGQLVTAQPADRELGYVGEVARVDPRVLCSLLDDGVVPVVATVARGPDGQDYNINADTVAAALASALRADKLIYLSNVAGLYDAFGSRDRSLLSEVHVADLRAMLDTGQIVTGMVPKITGCIDALEQGVGQAHLLDGRVEHALLLEIFTDAGVGTMILPSPEAAATPAERAT
ncbi:MAG: acetylglutamate kinase [Actinobacteria bacterium]|nr:acetylglutamate kinase [Actinomycetota bacterium]